MSNLLALDQSSRISGYAVFRDSSLIAHGIFDFKENNLGIRLEKIRNAITDIINKYNIDEVLFEDIQYQTTSGGNNTKTFKILSEVIGVIEELLTEKKIPYKIIPSTTWKSRLGIKGYHRAEQKIAAREYVLAHYDIEPTQDECDAICIGTYGLIN